MGQSPNSVHVMYLLGFFPLELVSRYAFLVRCLTLGQIHTS